MIWFQKKLNLNINDRPQKLSPANFMRFVGNMKDQLIKLCICFPIFTLSKIISLLLIF